MSEQGKIQLFESSSPRSNSRRFDMMKFNALVPPGEESEFWTRWRVAKKRQCTVLAVALAVLTLVLIATLKEKPVYEAKGLLEIEQENPNVVTLQDLFQVGNVSDTYLETQYRILQSDTLARAVIKQLHLDQAEEFNPPREVWPWQRKDPNDSNDSQMPPTDPAHEGGVLRRFQERLDVTPLERSRLVRVSFDAQDPRLAAAIVNYLAQDYIQENLQMHWDATQRATAWMSQQLDGLKIKLEKSEDNLQEYAQANGLVFLEDGKGQSENIEDQRLRDLQTELTQVQADRYQKEAQFRLVAAGDYGSLPGAFDNKVAQDLTEKLAELERQQAELVPDFKPGYPKMRQIQSEIDRIKQILEQEREDAAKQVADQYFAVVHREALVKQAFQEQQKEANATAGKLVQYNILKREADSNKQLYEGLLQRLKEAGVSAGLRASNIRIIDSAVSPSRPVKPRLILNLSVGLFVGLCCGLALAFLQERMDRTLSSSADVERFLRIPSLAMIPSAKFLELRKNGRKLKPKSGAFESAPSSVGSDGKRLSAMKKISCNGWIRVDTKPLARSALAEAFRGLRTSILLSAAGSPPRSLAFISSQPGEGKTTICCNLAIQLAQLGKRVLVVDGDMRRSSVHSFFELGDERGLANYLAGEGDWRHYVGTSDVNRLDCIAGGP